MISHARLGFGVCLLLLAASPLEACSCLWTTKTSCREVHENLVAFVGTVTQIEFEAVDSKRVPLGTRYTFKVDEALFGVTDPVVEVFSGGTTCDSQFEEGVEYIVFSSSAHDRLYAGGVCSKTAPLASAQHVLNNYRNLRDGKEVPTISGTLWKSLPYNSSIATDDHGGPIPDTGIRLTGESVQLATTTGRDGTFSFSDVPPGDYNISVDLPPTLRAKPYIVEDWRFPDSEDDAITIEADTCYEGSIYARPTGLIHGRVVDSGGRILRRANLSLFLTERYGQEYPPWGLATDYQGEEGFFEFDELTEGEYLLVYNEEDKVDPNIPYPRTYYPGVTELASALPIVLREGEQKIDIEFRLRISIPIRKLTVHVRWPNGTPGGNVRVLAEPNWGEWPEAHEIEPGTYALNLLPDTNYSVWAAKLCPDEVSGTISKKLTVHGSDDHISEIRLILPAMDCGEFTEQVRPEIR